MKGMRKKKIHERLNSEKSTAKSRRKGLSLYELSISGIEERKLGEASVDVQQEKDLISQMKNTLESNDDYGLHTFNNQQNINKTNNSQSNTSNGCNKKNAGKSMLHFNSDIKRKNRSRKKLPAQTSRISDKYLPLNSKFKQPDLEKGKKAQPIITSACNIAASVDCPRKHFKKSPIKVNLDDDPLDKALNCGRIQNDCHNLYYLRGDEFKAEVNDIDANLQLGWEQTHIPASGNKRKKSIRRSQSQIRDKYAISQMSLSVRPWWTKRKNLKESRPEVYSVKKSISLDPRSNSSLLSSTRSSFSRESTSTQIIGNSTGPCYSYPQKTQYYIICR